MDYECCSCHFKKVDHLLKIEAAAREHKKAFSELNRSTLNMITKNKERSDLVGHARLLAAVGKSQKALFALLGDGDE